MCAVYRREFGDAAENALREGRCKIDALFGADTNVIEEEELEVAGFSPRIFRNLNTPEELAEAGVERSSQLLGSAEILRGKERRSG